MNVPESVAPEPGAPRHLPQETGKVRTTTHAHTGSAVAQQLQTAIMAGKPAFHAPFSVSNAYIFAQWKAVHCGVAAAEMDRYLQQAQTQVLATMPAESEGLP